MFLAVALRGQTHCNLRKHQQTEKRHQSSQKNNRSWIKHNRNRKKTQTLTKKRLLENTTEAFLGTEQLWKWRANTEMYEQTCIYSVLLLKHRLPASSASLQSFTCSGFCYLSRCFITLSPQICSFLLPFVFLLFSFFSHVLCSLFDFCCLFVSFWSVFLFAGLLWGQSSFHFHKESVTGWHNGETQLTYLNGYWIRRHFTKWPET